MKYVQLDAGRPTTKIGLPCSLVNATVSPAVHACFNASQRRFSWKLADRDALAKGGACLYVQARSEISIDLRSLRQVGKKKKARAIIT
jgi:hypothetical protein